MDTEICNGIEIQRTTRPTDTHTHAPEREREHESQRQKLEEIKRKITNPKQTLLWILYLIS